MEEPDYKNPQFGSTFEKQEFKTHQHVTGLPPCDLADKLDRMEALYVQCLRRLDAARWWEFWRVSPNIRDVLTILRAQVSELALFSAGKIAEDSARASREHFGAEYHKLTEEMRKMVVWLDHQCPTYVQEWEGRNTSMWDKIRQVIMDLKTMRTSGGK